MQDSRQDILKESPDPCNSTPEGSPTLSDDLSIQGNQICHTLLHVGIAFTYVSSKQIHTVCWICWKETNLRNSSVESNTIKYWNASFIYSNWHIEPCHIHHKHDKSKASYHCSNCGKLFSVKQQVRTHKC